MVSVYIKETMFSTEMWHSVKKAWGMVKK